MVLRALFASHHRLTAGLLGVCPRSIFALVIMNEAIAESRRLNVAADEGLWGHLVMVAAYRLDQVAPADKVLVMKSGEVMEAGSYEELPARGGEYARFRQAWMGGRRG